MGLDQHVYSVKESCPEKAEKIVKTYWNDDGKNDQVDVLMYWRKHPDLHGWMETLYNKRGRFGVFNGVLLKLEKEDITQLEKDIEEDNLPYTTGFFFGSSEGKDKQDDLNFCKSAFVALKEGYHLYYDSSW